MARSPRIPLTALVTGASAGLGQEFARQLARAGVDLVLVARDGDRLERLAEELRRRHGVAVTTLPADLTDPAQLDRIADRITASRTRASAPGSEERPIDILVNNAGFGVYDAFEASSIDDERRLHELLSWVPLRLAHAAVPGMLDRGYGWILNVASVAAFTPTGTYGAAKAAVVSLSRALNARYRRRGVHVTALCPGLLATEFHERMGEDHLPQLPRIAWASTERVAREGLAGVRRGTSVVVSDWRYRLLFPLTRLLPARVLERISTTSE